MFAFIVNFHNFVDFISLLNLSHVAIYVCCSILIKKNLKPSFASNDSRCIQGDFRIARIIR